MIYNHKLPSIVLPLHYVAVYINIAPVSLVTGDLHSQLSRLYSVRHVLIACRANDQSYLLI
jgi:hypothetical protein